MRLHHLDLARALLMVLGIAYHAALVYAPPESMPWRVASDQTWPIFGHLEHFIHDFRMYAFYLVSGLFTGLLIARRGAAVMLRHRLLKLGVPLVVCGATFNTAMNLMSTQWHFHLGPGADLGTYVLRGEWLGHLWFLGNLLVYVVLAVALQRPLSAAARLDDTRGPTVPLLLVGLTALSAAGLSVLATRLGWDRSWLFLTPEALLSYLPFFALGQMLWHAPALFERLIAMRLAVPLVVTTAVAQALAQQAGLAGRSYAADQVVLALHHAALSLAVLALIGRFRRPNRWTQRLSAASYTIYLLHQPVIVALFGLAQALALGPLAGFMVLALATLALTWTLHEQVIARWPVLAWLLNGQPLPVPPNRRVDDRAHPA